MRRIKKASIQRLALCKRGKNGLTTLFKSDGTFQMGTLIKGNAEKGELLAVMYPKGLTDADGDFVDTVEAIKSMSASLIQNGGALDIEHDGEVLAPEAAYISEIFTIQKSDPRFADWKDYDGKPTDVSGGVAVQIQIDDPVLRDAYRDGDWDGVSVFGPAVVEQVDMKAASKRVAARMSGVQENQMTEAELQAALDAQDIKTAALVKSAIQEAMGKNPEAKPVDTKGEFSELPPKFTGEPNAENLKVYGDTLKAYEMRKAIASGDLTAADIAEMAKSMSETGPTQAELKKAGIETKEDDTPEVKALQVKLFKARQGTNAPERKESMSEEAQLAKANNDEGMELAKLINHNMGAASNGMTLHQG